MVWWHDPMWIAAVAAWAGVFVNLAVVLVALSPIHAAKRERETRGLLVAAYLRTPIGMAHGLISLGHKALDASVQPDQPMDGLEIETNMARLRALPSRVRALLNRFDIADAASLPDDVGQQLAQAVGMAQATLDALEVFVTNFDTATNSSQSPDVIGERRRQVVQQYASMTFDLAVAVEALAVFRKYCEGLFLPPPPHRRNWWVR